MSLLRIAARVAAHTYQLHWAGPSDVIPWVRGYFENTHNMWIALKETGKDEYEAEIEDGLTLTVKGPSADKESVAKGETQIFVNNKPMGSLEEAADTVKKLRKQQGVEVTIAPFKGNTKGIDYDLKQYNYDHGRTNEELEVSWSDRSGNKVELHAVTSGGGTQFKIVRVNGTDVTQAATDGNWAEVGKYYKPPTGEAFDLNKHIFIPASEAVEDSADQNAKELERWTSGPGTFFDWIKGEGYSVVDGKVSYGKTPADDATGV